MSKKIWSLLLFLSVTLTLFSVGSLLASAAEVVEAPGGEIHSEEELVAALGGEKAAQIKDNAVLLFSDIELQSPVVLLDGEYVLIGAGCEITASFEDGSFFVVGNGEKEASLRIGSSDTQSENDNLIFNGEGRTLDGSLVWVSGEATLEIFMGTVFQEVISSVCGGAVYSEGTFIMYAGRIENCRSTGSGGALFNKGEMYLASGTVSECSAEFGGAVYNEGTLELIGTEILSCTGTRGGAIFNSGVLNFRSSSVSECSASQGGGVYNSGEAAFIGGQILTSTAQESGGALYNSGTATFSGTYLNENTAVSGGNVYNISSVTLSEGQIYGGKASSCGGNIYNDTDASLSVSGGSIGRGEAVYGGGIYNLGTLIVSGGGFSSNKAELGGAILNDGTLIFTEYPYIDTQNDVFIVVDESNSHTVVVSSEMKADTIAILTPGVKNGDSYSVKYEEGMVLLTGDFAGQGYVKFQVTAADDGAEWTLSPEGALAKKLPVYYSPWFYVLLLAAFVVTVTVIVVVIRFCDKARSGKKIK